MTVQSHKQTSNATEPNAYQMFIGGQWFDRGADTIEVENPANEQIIATIPRGTAEDAQAALEAAKKAQPAWAAMPPIERAKLVHLLADALAANKAQLARTLVQEQGKPLNQAEGEVDASVTFLRYAAENARRIEGDIIPSDFRDEEIWIRRVPQGVVVGLTAWNFPLALAARKLGPALIAGNTFVLKAHEITPLSGLEFAKLSQQVGIPDGVFNVVTGEGRTVGQALVESPLSDLITMTGSTRGGKEIYAAAAPELKILRLELGGKAPFIVMDDANIDAAVDAAVIARFSNCGQICTCNERMYLHKDIADSFLEKFIAKASTLTIGDPMTNPDMGPKVSGAELGKVELMVKEAVDNGADVLLEGGVLKEGAYSKGHWYAPTVLRAPSNSANIMQNEIFGPVVPAIAVDSFEEALTFANDSIYGLSAFIYTSDMKRIMNLTQTLNFGELYINRPNGELVQGYHAGWKQSGLGGEDGKYGFDAYLKKKTMYVNWA